MQDIGLQLQRGIFGGLDGAFKWHAFTLQAPGGFQLLLNKYAIKTPGKHLLVLPTHALALAVAAEWEWQVGWIQDRKCFLRYSRSMTAHKHLSENIHNELVTYQHNQAWFAYPHLASFCQVTLLNQQADTFTNMHACLLLLSEAKVWGVIT